MLSYVLDRMTLLIRVSKQVQRKSFQNPLLCRFLSESSALRKGPESKEECKWLYGSSQEMLSVVRGHVEVRQNFISEEEEDALFKEVETGLRKKRYEFDHWDDVSTMEKYVNTAIQRQFITKLIL